MALTVTFYDFKKKENSTEQPDTASNPDVVYYVSANCNLKEATSFISPALVLELGFNPIGDTKSGISFRLNYCKINDFKRYYFVDDWTWMDGRWIASLRLDVLASWKTEIGNTSSYVLRSSSSYDTNIVDTVYPCKAGSTMVGQEIDTEPYSGNTLLVGIIGAGAENVNTGAVTYYAMTQSEASAFLTYMLGGNTTGGSSLEGLMWQGLNIVENGLKALVNPFQYVASAQWFPISFTGTTVSAIKFGQWTMQVSATRLAAAPVKIVQGSITIPKHPQAASKGLYLYTSPYSRYTLHYEPFGRIPLNASLMKGYSYLYCQNWIDGISGEGKLVVYATNDVEHGPLVEIGAFTAQIGVPVQLAQITNNVIGASIGALGGAFSMATSGSISALGEIGDAAMNLMPQLISSGGNGTNAVYLMPNPALQLEYLNIVDINNDHKGRPLCQEKTLNTLSGYIQCMDGEVKCNASASELESIKTYLENGFFYE